MKSFLQVLLILTVLVNVNYFAQLKEFEIRQETPPEAIPVFPNNPDDAALIVYSSLTSLNFESNTGGITDIKGSTLDGKYVILLKPERQILIVKSPGFREGQIKLMSLETKSVLYYSIEQRQKLLTSEKGKFILNTIPQRAEFEVDGLPIKSATPYESEEFRAGTYKIKIKKTGYEPVEVLLTIEAGRVISKTVELIPDINFIDYTQNFSYALGLSDNLRNVMFLQDGDNLIIYYDLDGDTQSEYNVEMLVRGIKDESIEYTPQSLSGDIGVGKYVGRSRQIVWDVGKDFPQGLDDEQYSIELRVEEESGGLPWYLYVGGAIVGGTVAAVLLGGTGNSDGGTTTTLVEPPGRPGN